MEPAGARQDFGLAIWGAFVGEVLNSAIGVRMLLNQLARTCRLPAGDIYPTTWLKLLAPATNQLQYLFLTNSLFCDIILLVAFLLLHSPFLSCYAATVGHSVFPTGMIFPSGLDGIPRFGGTPKALK